MISIKTYKDRLKDLREDNGLSQSEVALILKISQQHYQLKESAPVGKRDFKPTELMILSKYYNVTTDYILLGKKSIKE